MNNKLGSFTLIKNEIMWIGPHLASWLPHLDEMCFFDGNSTDGTLEIIKQFSEYHPDGHKIILVENKDPKDLNDDYVCLFNECLRTLKTDYAIFLHPDMLPDGVINTKNISDGVAYFTHIRSFAGNPGGDLLEIEGRNKNWKNIYRLNNPDLGAHYFGHYGAYNEDVYFSEITGEAHAFHDADFSKYPYEIADSGLKILHFSDVRSYERRLNRMLACLKNQKKNPDIIEKLAKSHPRVTLKEGFDFYGSKFVFSAAKYPEIFTEWRKSLRQEMAIK